MSKLNYKNRWTFVCAFIFSISTLSEVFAQNPITVSKVIHSGKNSYIEANGQPYLMYGIQMRLDNYLDLYGTTAPIFQYFEKASSAGFKDVILPLSWGSFEQKDNVFSYVYLDSILANAHKYNLRIQLMWFGSNVCAYSELPWYINNDVANYPKFSSTQWSPVSYSAPKLIEKEVRAVKTLMNYINVHDTEKRIVMIQVENEPNHKGPLVDYWAGNQEVATKHMLDTLGKVVHASNSNMVTRVNLIGGYYDTTALKAIKGIDIFGSDLYMNVLSDYSTYLKKLDYAANVNHTPENGGQYPNGINLALAAFERADGYLLYEIRTTGKKWLDEYDLGFFVGTLANDWVQRPFYDDMKSFNEMVYKADKKIARCPRGSIATFNQANSTTTVSETKSIGTYSVAYSSTNGGEAIALVDELGEIVLLSHNNNSSFTISNLFSNAVASIGKYDDTNKWQETNKGTIVNNTITLMAGEVARIYGVCSSAPPTVTASADVHICKGSSTTLTASGGGAYTWSSGQTLNNTTEFHFNTVGNTEGWGLANQLTGGVANGVITASLSGSDPFMFSDWTLKIPAATQTKVRIRMKNSTSGTQAMFMWLTSTDGNWWTNGKAIYFPIKANDTDYTEYVLDMTQKVGWKDIVTMLRLDPVESGASTGSVNIDWIKITSDQSITVAPQETTTYTVTVTDKYACTSTDDVVVVVDVCTDDNIVSYENKNFQIYPNPTSGDVTVNVPSLDANAATITVSNILGENLLTKNINLTSGQNQITLSTSQLTKGIYFVKIHSGSLNGSTKLVIEK